MDFAFIATISTHNIEYCSNIMLLVRTYKQQLSLELILSILSIERIHRISMFFMPKKCMYTIYNASYILYFVLYIQQYPPVSRIQDPGRVQEVPSDAAN